MQKIDCLLINYVRTIDNTLSSRQLCLELKGLFKYFNDCKEGHAIMKRPFILFAIFALVGTEAYARPSKPKKGATSTVIQTEEGTKKKVKTEVVSKTEVAAPKTSFEKFSDRLRISYWAAFTSPHADDIVKGQYRNAAISPAYGNAKTGEQKNHDTWPMNLWNQISFNYNFGAKMNFVVNPRFMIPLASGKDMKAPEDRSLIMLDDMLVGFQGVVLSTDDKKFNLWIRPGVRLPMSQASRNSRNGGFGRTTQQNEIAYLPTYDFNKTWQVGLFGQVRQWVFSDRMNYSRLRFYTAPYFQYTFNDTSRLQVYYEHMWENNKRWESVNGKKPVFKDVWQNVMIGVNHDVTKKFNIFPYLGVFVDDGPITDKSAWLGAWISYQIK